MDEAFNARFDLDECAVVSDENNLAGNLVADLEVRIEAVPRMLAELLQAEGNPLLLLIEVENDNLDLFVELDNLFRVVDAAP